MVVREVADGVVGVEGFSALVYRFNSLAFLHHMAIVFLVIAAVMIAIAKWKPRAEPVTYPTSDIDVTVPRSSYVIGTLVILATVALYVIFW